MICVLFIGISIPIAQSLEVNTSTDTNSAPLLIVDIMPSFSLFSMYFSVKNVGNSAARNINYSGMTVAGYVIYNSKPHLITTSLEPGAEIIGFSDRFIGFGIFTAKITITCDGGVNATDYANGIALGIFNFIP